MPDVRETGRIYCIEDAHTRSNSAYNQHEGETNINSVAVGRHSDGYQCYGFFKFAPHGLPDNAVIVSALLGGRVYGRLLEAVSTLTARPCSGPWTDAEITYRTMPTSTGVSDRVDIGGDTGSPFEADVTAIAQAWMQGDFAYENGLYITSSAASSYKRVYSHTAADDSKPYISITYYVPASKPTADVTGIEIAAGATVGITTNRLSDEYTHTLTWALGSATGAIAENVTGAYEWTFTDADVSALLAALPAAESGTLQIVCETFDAAGISLGTESAALTATVPADVLPQVTAINITGLDLGKGQLYLSGISRMQVDVTALPGEGSAIASVIITAGGKKYSGTSVTTDPLSGGDEVGADVSVTDARGRSIGGSYTSAIPVYNYAAPAVNAFAIERCNEDGTAAQIDGEYLRFTLDASASLISMPSVNQVTAEIYTKLRSASDWTLAGSYNNESNALKLENAVLPGTYSPLSSYDILLRLTDGMGTSADRLTVITTATSLQHYDPFHTRVTFGRIGESTDPERALITALDLVAEAGVRLHGADVADGVTDLPDGGMIAANASFAAQVTDGAIRTLSGVQATATGKNMFCADWELGAINVTTGDEQTNASTIRCGYIPVTPGETYAIYRSISGSSFAVRGYDANKNYLGKGDACITLVRGATATNPIPVNGNTAAFTVNESVHYLRFVDYTNDLSVLCQLELGAENTAYEPCRASAMTCDFGAALPAAEVDFAAGIWRETWGYIASYAGETVPDGWISSTGALDTGAQVAYPLAAPIEHTFTPQLIAAPAGPCIITTNADALAAHVAGGRIFYTIARALNALGRT